MKKELILLLGIIFLVIPLSLADLNSGIPCAADGNCVACESSYQNQYRCYCYSQTNTCWINTSSLGSNQATGQPDDTLTAPSSTNNQPNLTAVTSDSGSLQTALGMLQQQVSASDSRNQQQLTTLQSSLSSLQQQVSQLSLQVQSVSLQEGQVSSLRTELGSVSSGLASLQQNFDSTKSELSAIENNFKNEQKRTKLLSGLVYSLVVLAAAGTLVYFISSRRRKIDPQILKYITNHLKKGARYPEIKANLQNAGWGVEDIDWVYQATLKHYRKYHSENNNRTNFDKNKIAGISIVSILIIVSLIFLLKGITTGQAIRFETEEELSRNVLQTLQSRLANNQFYNLVQSATLCVEVKDGLKSVSYRIVKTMAGQSIDPALRSCSEDTNYNAAVKFTGWNSFEHLMNDFTCRTARELHLERNGIRGIYVLPSQLVLPGFRKNPQVNYQLFCPLLRACLTPTELAVLGCN